MLDELEAYKKQCMNSEHNWYLSMPMNIRKNLPHMEGALNSDNVFYHYYIDKSLEVYREVFQELEKQLRRTKYLKKKIYGNFAGPIDELPPEIEDQLMGKD